MRRTNGAVFQWVKGDLGGRENLRANSQWGKWTSGSVVWRDGPSGEASMRTGHWGVTNQEGGQPLKEPIRMQ